MNVIMEIYEVNPAMSKSGREYHTITTSKGSMTCFEEEVASALAKNKGKLVEAEVKERGNYRNITKFIGLVEEKIQIKKPSKDQLDLALAFLALAVLSKESSTLEDLKKKISTYLDLYKSIKDSLK